MNFTYIMLSETNQRQRRPYCMFQFTGSSGEKYLKVTGSRPVGAGPGGPTSKGQERTFRGNGNVLGQWLYSSGSQPS